MLLWKSISLQILLFNNDRWQIQLSTNVSDKYNCQQRSLTGTIADIQSSRNIAEMYNCQQDRWQIQMLTKIDDK